MHPIDPESEIPPFDQVRRQIIDDVRSGRLAAGAKLPTVRALADELGLATNTVAKAYRALETDGAIVTRGRNGSYIAASGDVTHQSAQLAAAAFAERMRELEIDPDEAVALVRSALGAG